MEIGIFAKTFSRPAVSGVFDEITRLGLQSVQFNFACVGLPVIPEAVPDALIEEIRTEALRSGVRIAALSATFNIIDPDLEQRDRNLQRLTVLAAASEALACPVLAMSTGTRDRHDMWHAHPDNASDAAWNEMLESLRLALWLTEPYNVTLAVEPEPGNVMADIWKARRLLDEIASPRLKIVFDAANILDGMPNVPQADALAEAFQILGRDIALAHGKEWSSEATGAKIPGRGTLDWRLYLELLARHYSGSVVLHGFDEEHAEEAIRFVKNICHIPVP